MFKWLLSLFDMNKISRTELKNKVIDEVAERRDAMEATVAKAKTKAKTKAAAVKKVATAKTKLIKDEITKMSKAELLAYAKKEKIKVVSSASKATVLDTIKKALK